jgi:hypothetical protein
MQDNHLQLFEFVGRMLGKAVYEVTETLFVKFLPHLPLVVPASEDGNPSLKCCCLYVY